MTIEKTALVREVGDKFEPVKSFKPDAIFGLLVFLSEPKIGTKVKGVWTAVGAGGLENKKIFEKEVEFTPEALKDCQRKEPRRFHSLARQPVPDRRL